MSNKIRGVNAGKEIFLSKDDLEKCYFCDKYVVPINFMWQKTIEQMKQFQKVLGEIPNDTAGKIGNKLICKSCLGDLENLLPFKYCYDD